MQQIYDFVEYELNIFRNECNFSDDELEYFNCKAKNYSNVKIACKMNISIRTVARLSSSVHKKMERVKKYHTEELN